eukprot:5837639-Prymnesium_polylepis.1
MVAATATSVLTSAPAASPPPLNSSASASAGSVLSSPSLSALSSPSPAPDSHLITRPAGVESALSRLETTSPSAVPRMPTPKRM